MPGPSPLHQDQNLRGTGLFSVDLRRIRVSRSGAWFACYLVRVTRREALAFGIFCVICLEE